MILCSVALMAPAAAHGSTTIGPVPTNPGPESSIQAILWPDGSLIFTTAVPPGQQLTAPASGTITSWRLYTDAVGTESSVQLRVLAPLGGKEYKVVRSGPVQPIDAVSSGVAKKNALHVFQVSVPISAGEMVGVALFHKNASLLLPALPATEATGWQYGCLTCEAGPVADGGSATAQPIPNQWVAMTAEIDGEEGGGTEPPSCIGSLCSTPTIPSPSIPPLTLQSPQSKPKSKKCKKGKKRKHGKCVKKHRKKQKR